MNIYEVYENNQLVYSGSRVEVCNHFEISQRSSLKVYTTDNYKLKGKYKIVIKKYEKPNKEQQSEIDYLVEHLSKYGNTVFRNDPTPYLEELKKRGFNVIVTEFELDTPKEILINENQTKAYRKRAKECGEKEYRIISHLLEVA